MFKMLVEEKTIFPALPKSHFFLLKYLLITC